MQNVMQKLTYGLFLLTSVAFGKNNGCVINTVGQVTSSPNRISIVVNKSNLTHDIIQQTGRFTVSVISQDADFALFQRFGFRSGRNVNKFEDFQDYRKVSNWTVCITKGTNAFLSGEVIQEIDLGTHTMFLADVTETGILSDSPSASYAYYSEHIKPKLQESDKIGTGQTVWRCSVCGYVYTGEELPEDYICPLCKHPASDFEKSES